MDPNSRIRDGLNKCLSQIKNILPELLQTLCFSHPIISVTLMVDKIIKTPDTATTVANNIKKTDIPPKRALVPMKGESVKL